VSQRFLDVSRTTFLVPKCSVAEVSGNPENLVSEKNANDITDLQHQESGSYGAAATAAAPSSSFPATTVRTGAYKIRTDKSENSVK